MFEEKRRRFIPLTGHSFAIRPTRDNRVVAVEALSGRSLSRHHHDEYGVGMVLSGAHSSWSGRGHVEAVAGDVITVNPGEVHDGRPVGTHRGWRMLYLPAELVAEELDDDGGAQAAAEFEEPVTRNPALARTFGRAFAYATSLGPGDALGAEQALVELLHTLLRPAAPHPGLTPASIGRMKSRLDASPFEQHCLAELAAEAGLSRHHALRAFRQHTGMTPHDYLVQLRLDRARLLIASGDALATVSASTGFFDQSHMTRAFARRYGITPGAFALAVRK